MRLPLLPSTLQAELCDNRSCCCQEPKGEGLQESLTPITSSPALEPCMGAGAHQQHSMQPILPRQPRVWQVRPGTCIGGHTHKPCAEQLPAKLPRHGSLKAALKDVVGHSPS